MKLTLLFVSILAAGLQVQLATAQNWCPEDGDCQTNDCDTCSQHYHDCMDGANIWGFDPHYKACMKRAIAFNPDVCKDCAQPQYYPLGTQVEPAIAFPDWRLDKHGDPCDKDDEKCGTKEGN